MKAIQPPHSLLALTGLGLVFCLGLTLVAGYQFSDEMLPPFWVALDYRALDPIWQFVSGNALYNLLGYTVTAANGQQLTLDQFHLLGITMIVACYLALFSSSVVRFGVERAAIFLGCVVLTSLDSTLLHWIGKSDPLLVLAYLIVFFGRANVWVTAVGFALLVGAHREQAAVISVLHLLVLMIERRLSPRLLLGIVGGLLVGFGGIYAYDHALGLAGARDRLDYALGQEASVVTYSLKFVLKWIGLALPSVLLGGWWLALNAMHDRRTTLLLLMTIGLGTLVAATTHDFTRNAALLGMPVTFYLAEYYARRWKAGEGLAPKWAAALAFVALIGYEVQDNRVLAFERPGSVGEGDLDTIRRGP